MGSPAARRTYGSRRGAGHWRTCTAAASTTTRSGRTASATSPRTTCEDRALWGLPEGPDGKARLAAARHRHSLADRRRALAHQRAAAGHGEAGCCRRAQVHRAAGLRQRPLQRGCMHRRQAKPVLLVEGEIDAMTAIQEAGDLIAAVATGSTAGARREPWIGRLAAAPCVLLAFDCDRNGAGDRRRPGGCRRLPNAVRWRPLLHDVNAMHVRGVSVRTWAAAGIEYALQTINARR